MPAPMVTHSVVVTGLVSAVAHVSDKTSSTWSPHALESSSLACFSAAASRSCKISAIELTSFQSSSSKPLTDLDQMWPDIIGNRQRGNRGPAIRRDRADGHPMSVFDRYLRPAGMIEVAP